MRSYSGSAQSLAANLTANFLGVFNPTGITSIRARIFEFVFGSSVTPADQASRVLLSRFTALPTGGTLNQDGSPLDSNDGTSIAKWYGGNTGGGTPGTTLFAFGLNQRATFRHIAAPGKEFIIPSVALAGIGLYVIAQTASYNYDATIMWEE